MTAAELISQIGFPAGAAIILIVYLTRNLNGKLDRLVKGLSDNLEATRENTTQVSRLVDRMDSGT